MAGVLKKTWFAAEKDVYEAMLSEWLQAGKKNKYVVILGSKVLGFYSQYDDALLEGLQHADLGGFMVKRVQPADTVEWMSHIAVRNR